VSLWTSACQRGERADAVSAENLTGEIAEIGLYIARESRLSSPRGRWRRRTPPSPMAASPAPCAVLRPFTPLSVAGP
jgi:hypothetical protein